MEEVSFDHLEQRSQKTESFVESFVSEGEKVQCPSCLKQFDGNLQWITEKHLAKCIEQVQNQKIDNQV